jgi:hypothetical protein
MCTVTVLRAANLLRVMCNRDERRDRPNAHPPFITISAGQRVIAPQDPVGRGTWIAANSAGLVFTLLNEHRASHPRRPGRHSRGLIIPALVDATALEEVAFRVADVAPGDYGPFRLLVADDLDIAEFAVVEGEWRTDMHRLIRPLFFTSSSLGDAIVDGPRRLLFDQVFASDSMTGEEFTARQDAFHAHRWRDRPAISVHMSRPDACTVSTTTVEVTPSQVRMLYHPSHCVAGTPVGLVIDRANARNTAARRIGREYARV